MCTMLYVPRILTFHPIHPLHMVRNRIQRWLGNLLMDECMSLYRQVHLHVRVPAPLPVLVGPSRGSRHSFPPPPPLSSALFFSLIFSHPMLLLSSVTFSLEDSTMDGDPIHTNGPRTQLACVCASTSCVVFCCVASHTCDSMRRIHHT